MRTNEIGAITEEKLLDFAKRHGHVRVETENSKENSPSLPTENIEN